MTAVILALLIALPGVASAAGDGIDEDGAAGPVIEGADTRAEINAATDVTGDSRAHIDGAWSDAVEWPIAAIHAILLPGGEVMTYGTDDKGTNSTGFTYDIWDPSRGMGPGSHTTLPVGTSSNLFCSGQTVLPWNGKVLLTGGEENGLPGGQTSDAVNDVNIFDPSSRSITRLADSMSHARWYPTVTTLPSGEVLVHGGRDDKPAATPITTPEVYHPTNGWRRLTGADSDDVYGSGRWWYPRSWVAPDGNVFIVTKGDQGMWSLNPSGAGSVRRLGTYPGDTTDNTTPAAMYDVGKVLITTKTGTASVIDINRSSPQVSSTNPLMSARSWSDATVLPDGQVLVTGGASQRQKLDHAVYDAELWDPDTGTWHQGAAASKARLYHSTAMLLPDATVLTSGGGPPGPVVNMNSEIYHPPYLFRADGSGEFASRPKIAAHSEVRHGGSFTVDLGNSSSISDVVLVRTASVTHSFDMDQRRIPLSFSQSGDRLTVAGPPNANIAPPGQYMLFVIDDKGVPSVAKIFRLSQVNGPSSANVQVGDLTIANTSIGGRWISATFPRPFDRRPIVTVGGPSSDGSEPLVTRVRNVTKTGFEVQIQEWPYQDGDHMLETISYLAAEPGRHTLGGVTIEAGAATVSDRGSSVRFSQRFGTRPIVLSQVTSEFDAEPVVTRAVSVWRSRFKVRLQEQEASRRSGQRHGNETVHYIALTKGRGSIDGRALRVRLTSPKITGSWTTLQFNGSYAEPSFMAASQTFNGADPIGVRYRQLTTTAAHVRVQEEKSHDREVSHPGERVGFVVVEAK